MALQNRILPFQSIMFSDQTFGNQRKKQRIKSEYLYGVNSVYAALRAQRRETQKLYLNIAEKGDGDRQPSERIQKIKDLAKEVGLKSKYMHRLKMAKFCGGRQH